MRRAAAALALPALALAVAASAVPAGADSFTPVRMSERVTPIGRLHVALPVHVVIHADAGVLDTAQGKLRVEVKLATECGADYQTTPGVSLVNAQLRPQPTVGKAYSGGARGSGRPTAYGTRTVCTFLEDPQGDRVYANDESTTVDVTRACTTAGRAYDGDRRALLAAERALRHARTAAARSADRAAVARRERALVRAQRHGRAVCGRGVEL